MLEIKNISVKYGETQVLKDLSFNIDEQNNVVGVLGKNGAGKTTLFDTLFGDLEFSGEILWRGNKLRKTAISYVETQNYFYPYITGNEYLNYFVQDKREIDELADRFNLPLKAYVNNYSTGMKKKLAILSMLLQNKLIVLLDEPFNGLDFESVHMLYDLIQKMKSDGKLILISSHIIETLFNTCDKIIILNHGKVEKSYLKNEFDEILL
ncbi:ABC transporter ATP-binding protein [Ornithobacterium rhinotracheale]|uniref:ABC transporter ATP-binding protein n=1 Tax=Ornithobacterium rhinotracheale TaxID=28251 RepID=UPI003FA4B3BD